MRYLLLILIIMLAIVPVYGQSGYTTVTATVTDVNNLPYAAGNGSASLVPGSFSGLYLIAGVGPVPSPIPLGTFSSTGSFSVSIPDNNVITPSGSQWRFNICAAANTSCFNAIITITGSSQDISAALKTASTAALPNGLPAASHTTAGTGAPSGSCSNNGTIYTDTSAGNAYICKNGAWVVIAGGGGAINPTTNTLPKRQNATTFADSSISDNGTTVVITEPMTVNGGVSNCLPFGTGAAFCMAEGTDATPQAGFDIINADSAAHCLKVSFNGGAFSCVGGISFPLTVAGTVNSGGIPCFTSTTNEASSATIAAGATVIGGGSGACVTSLATTVSGSNITYPGTIRPAGVSGANPEQSVSPLDFGAKADVQFVNDCSWTNATTQVTCANGDMNCVTADAGKIMFGVSATNAVTVNALNDVVSVPQGTISSCASSTVYNISTTTTATCPNAGSGLVNCEFAKGTQDDATALNNAAASAWNGGSTCKAVQLPSAYMFIGSAVFNGASIGNSCGNASVANGQSSDLTSVGPELFGEGQSNSVLIPLPSFNFASCTGGSGAACIGGAPNLQAHDFGVNGLQNPVINANNPVTLFELFGSNAGGGCAGGSTGWNLSLSGWALQSSLSLGFKAFKNGCNDPYLSNINAVMFGQSTCTLTGGSNSAVVTALFCFGSGAGPVLSISFGGTLTSIGGQYMCFLASSRDVIQFFGASPGTFVSIGDTINTNSFNCNSVGGNLIDAQTTPETMFAFGDSIASTVASTGVLSSSGGFLLHLRDSVVSTNGAGKLINMGATDSLFDEGGNIFTQGSTTSTYGHVIGQTNSAVATACATGNFALTSGWGTSSVASVASNGGIQGCHVTITGAAGSAGPVLTWTYPLAPLVAPGSCHIVGVSGTLTGVAVGTPGATTVAFTFAGTPSAQTYVFDVGCP